MQLISFSFFFFFFFFLHAISHQITAHSTLITNPKSSSDILINQTCKKCADQSPVISYSFCTSSLPTVPVSRAITNLQGLALVAMELALENATNTVLIIEQLLANKTSAAGAALDPPSLRCLEDCRDLYSDGVATLADAIRAFLDERYDTAGVWLSAVMEAPTTCEEGFKDLGKEVVYPLGIDNYELFQLCDIALCIGHLLSSHESFLCSNN